MMREFLYCIQLCYRFFFCTCDKEKLPSKSSLEVQKFKDISGKGVTAQVAGIAIVIGSQKLLAEQTISIPEQYTNEIQGLMEKGQTVTFMAVKGKLVAFFGIADPVKEKSASVIETLKKMGVTSIMLTGDNKSTALAIAKEVDITEVVAEVLPDQKEKTIRELRKKYPVVAMVGDGINDAPALATADVGIAMGGGTDVAIESAGVTLLRSDISLVPTALSLSKATMRNIRQNLFWAFGYNVVLIPVAMGVLYPTFGIVLNPVLAGAAMAFSSVSVVLNALRLKTTHLE